MNLVALKMSIKFVIISIPITYWMILLLGNLLKIFKKTPSCHTKIPGIC